MAFSGAARLRGEVMMPVRSVCVCLLAIILTTTLCAARVVPPPVNPLEYREMRAARRASYPPQTILLYNLQRVLDGELFPPARADSMKIVSELGGEDPAVLGQLASVLSDARTPQPVREEVLAFLLGKDYPELAQYVVRFGARL